MTLNNYVLTFVYTSHNVQYFLYIRQINTIAKYHFKIIRSFFVHNENNFKTWKLGKSVTEPMVKTNYHSLNITIMIRMPAPQVRFSEHTHARTHTRTHTHTHTHTHNHNLRACVVRLRVSPCLTRFSWRTLSIRFSISKKT